MVPAGLLAGARCLLGRAGLPWGGTLQVFLVYCYPPEFPFFGMAPQVVVFFFKMHKAAVPIREYAN